MKKLVLLVFAGAGALLAQAPTIAAVLNGVEVNAGIQDTRLCPGIAAAIYGTNFGSSSSNVTVTVGGTNAVLSAVTPNQINAQFSFNAPLGATTLTVTVGGVASAEFNVTLTQTAPTVGLVGTTTAPAIYNTKNVQITGAAPANPGDTLLLYAAGLGPTNPPTPAGTIPSAPVPLAGTPTMTIGGQPATITFSGYGSSGYQINFTVPKTVQGSVPLILSIDGHDSPPVTLPLFGISAVVSAASFLNTSTAAPGEIVTIYANGVGSKDQTTTGYQTTTVQGVSVTFNGIAAPIFALATKTNQLNVIVPSELPTTGTVQVQLTTPGGTSLNFPLIMGTAVPGIFLIPDPSNAKAVIAAAQFANTVWLDVPTSTAMALQIPQNCTASKANPLSICGQPAAPGDYLVLYTTGLGEATPKGDPKGTPLATGVAAPADGSVLYETVATPTIQVGGVAATPLFSGVAPGFAGLYQVDFQVPTGVPEGDAVPLTISMPGSTTGTATLAVHSR